MRFRPGHKPKFEGKKEYEVGVKRQSVLTHNSIQNSIYEILLSEFPEAQIGTEVATNSGSVDLVINQDENFIFYEIKTEKSVKANIRQALSQLLEYAFWNEIGTFVLFLTT